MSAQTPSHREDEIAPSSAIPAAILGVIVFLVTLFCGTFAILPFVVPNPSWGLEIGSAVSFVVLVFSWLALFRERRERRSFSDCRLVLEDGFVTSDKPCRFRIVDRGNILNPASAASFSLGYQDEFRRTEGRKVYREGPFLLDVEIPTQFHAGESFPTLEGEFMIRTGDVKSDPPNENWEVRTVIILTMQVVGEGRCKFELPYLQKPNR